MKDSKDKQLVNILTSDGGILRCKSVLLGQEFDLEICITSNGQLSLSIDGNLRIEEAAQIIATKCEVPVESILPLLIVNLALLMEKKFEPNVSSTISSKVTIH